MQQKRIVSETPVKSNILGVELCTETTADEIVSAITEETGKFFLPQIEEVGTGTVVRLVTLTMDIYYGGASWSYIDVFLDEDSKVICIRLNASFESIDRAKDHFTVMKSTLEQTYGKGNEVDDNIAFWTDDTNSVRISYEESSAINGNDRSFCYMDYINIELSNEYEQANVPDV
jgi:hypothetical protein